MKNLKYVSFEVLTYDILKYLGFDNVLLKEVIWDLQDILPTFKSTILYIVFSVGS